MSLNKTHLTKERKDLFDNLVKYFFKTISFVIKCKSIGIKIEQNNVEADNNDTFYYSIDYCNDFLKSEICLTKEMHYDLECLGRILIQEKQKDNPEFISRNETFFIDLRSEKEILYENCKKCIKNFNQKCFEHFTNLILIPIILENSYIGIFYIANVEEEIQFDKIKKLEGISVIFSKMLLELEEKTKNIEKEFYNLSKLATIDFITGVNNRLALETRIKEEDNKIKHYATKFNFKWSVLYIDLDNFKYYNDNFGHIIGDQILKKVGEILKSSVRTSDFIARYGGDEFIIILPQTEAKDAKVLAERILKKINEVDFLKDINREIPTSYNTKLSCSIGIVEYKQGLRFSDLIKMADSAMYVAKTKGKNNYFIYQNLLQEELHIPDNNNFSKSY